MLAELSALLPDDAFLTAFRTRGDSLVVDGMAAHAAQAFDAIQRQPAADRRARAGAGPPRSARGRRSALERFTFAALRPRDPAGPSAGRAGRCAAPGAVMAALSAKDRRAILVGALVLRRARCSSGACGRIAPPWPRRATTWRPNARRQSRERGRSDHAQRNPALQGLTDSAPARQ